MIKKIPLAKPFLDGKEALAAKKVVQSGWLTQGPRVAEFEKAFAGAVRAKHAVALSSGTTALHLALLAVGVKPGDAVLTVSHSFIASANSVRHCGAEPIFIDVNRADLNIDIKALQYFLLHECVRRRGALYDKKKRRIAAILAVHQVGIPCQIESIVRMARYHRLPVVEDAACAVGSEIFSRRSRRWERIGKPHGDAACFSFHPRKVLTTGDGGMITTNNPSIDRFCRLRRVHGMNISSDVRDKAPAVVLEKYLVTGFNYRLTDIQAAIGIEQVKKLDGIISRRRKLAEKYMERLKNISWLRIVEGSLVTRLNWQSFVVEILHGAPLKPLALMNALLKQGIGTKPGIMNAHEEAPYKNQTRKLPVSERLRKNCILLPFYPQMTQQELNRVCEALQNAGKRKA